MEIQFSGNKDQAFRAARRFEKTIPDQNPRDRMSLMMDLCAADGKNGNDPLDWDRLINADDFNFLHDVGGIIRHMDRTTGKLQNCFVPRFARASSDA